jgi:hypothetical protein
MTANLSREQRHELSLRLPQVQSPRLRSRDPMLTFISHPASLFYQKALQVRIHNKLLKRGAHDARYLHARIVEADIRVSVVVEQVLRCAGGEVLVYDGAHAFTVLDFAFEDCG